MIANLMTPEIISMTRQSSRDAAGAMMAALAVTPNNELREAIATHFDAHADKIEEELIERLPIEEIAAVVWRASRLPDSPPKEFADMLDYNKQPYRKIAQAIADYLRSVVE
jgi:hypothetical protein